MGPFMRVLFFHKNWLQGYKDVHMLVAKNGVAPLAVAL